MSTTCLVSACLLGVPCRYDGASKHHTAVQRWVDTAQARGDTVISVCPEQLGGLSTPRPAADLRGGSGAAVLAGSATVQRVHDHKDVTHAFIHGARAAHALAPTATTALLKARSPSCGTHSTYIDGVLQPGEGVFAALLRAHGVTLRSEEDL